MPLVCQEGLKERSKRSRRFRILNQPSLFWKRKKQEKTLQFWKLIQHVWTLLLQTANSMTYPVNTFCDAAGHAGSFGSQHERTENPWGLYFCFFKKGDVPEISFTFFLHKDLRKGKKRVAKKKTMNIHEPLWFNNKSCWKSSQSCCCNFGWWSYIPSILQVCPRIRVERHKFWVFKVPGVFQNKGAFYTHG